MIARGDLGVEVPIEQIAVVQKRLMRLANMAAKPVITATQMLESMADNRRPTRAEATDVANAVLDGTDCVMLSAESAMGKYPVDAVAMLAKIAAAVEASRPAIAVKELYRGVDLTGKIRPEHLIAIGVEAGHGICVAGSRVRPDAQRQRSKECGAVPFPCLDGGRQLPGGDLSEPPVFFRNLSRARNGPPGKLEALHRAMVE